MIGGESEMLDEICRALENYLKKEASIMRIERKKQYLCETIRGCSGFDSIDVGW